MTPKMKPKIIRDHTQNQDHVITLVNLRTINTIVNKPVKPIPLDELLELLIFVVLIR
jgi:hypothetical protein